MMAGQNGQSTGEQTPSDEGLMGRLAAGEHEAIGPLHGRYAGLIYNLAAQSIGRASAEEIVQDVFVAVWQKARTFDPARGSFRTWVLRIAHLRVINELRRRGRRPKFEADPEGLGVGNLAEPRPGPDEAAWLDHRRAIVRDAVEALPPHQRQALRLAFLEDLSHQQIADFLNLPLGTTKTRIRAGLQKLRGHLAPLLAAGLLVGGLFATAIFFTAQRFDDARRDEAALRMVTSSDVVPQRLVAAPGTPAETHGNYRGRAGSTIAVTTVSHLRPAPAGQTYHVWGVFAGRWHLLGTVTPDAQERALLITEGEYLANPPSELRVTLEKAKNAASPAGPPIIVWPNP
jgi:RNA polymerase sigma-70 factor (ECF subfamily)